MPVNFQFASARDRLYSNSYLIQVLNSGSFTGNGFSTSGSIDIYLQSQNRAGFSLQSAKNQINYNAGQAIAITFYQNAILSGEEIFALVVSADNTNNAQNAIQIAAWNARESNQITRKDLPVTIYLTEDEHINLDKSYASENDFPQNQDLIIGAVVYLESDLQYYIYNSVATSGSFPAVGKPGYWVRNPFTWDTYVANTYNEQGLDCPLEEIYSQLPALPKSKGIDSTPIRYWIFNDSPENNGSSILENSKFQLEFSVNGLLNYDSLRSYNNLFADCVSITFIGVVRRLTGILYTDVEGANTTINWNPAKGQIIDLKQEILPGYAAVFDIWLNNNCDRLIDTKLIKPGQRIKLKIYEVISSGIISDLWLWTGDAILPGSQLMRVVPNFVLPGHALIQGYRVDINQNKEIVGLLENKANQLVVVSAARNGDVAIKQSIAALDPTESVRAIVSTLPGVSNPSEPSAVIALVAGDSLRAELNLPVDSGMRGIIRSDYPDQRIAGNSLGIFSQPKIRIYLEWDNVLYYKETLIDSFSQSVQIIEITDLEDFEQIPGIPQQPDPYFNLYSCGNINISKFSTNPSATLETGNYRLWWAWVYTSPNTKITKIDHDPANGTIPERNSLFSDSVNYWNSPILSIEEARALPVDKLKPGMVWTINSSQRYVPYVFDPNIVSADNGLSVIKPTSIALISGALVPLRTLGHRVINEDNILMTARHNLRFQGDVEINDDSYSNSTVITFTASTPQIPAISSNIIWNDGSIATIHDDTMLSIG